MESNPCFESIWDFKSALSNIIYAFYIFCMTSPGIVILDTESGSLFHCFSFPGTQFKVSVEYAPSQRVPRQWSKKDGRDGTIYKGTI